MDLLHLRCGRLASKVSDKAKAAAQDGHVRATAVGVAGGATTLGVTGAPENRAENRAGPPAPELGPTLR